MKPASEITDRAKRYRANKNPPPGPRRCNFCTSRQNVDIDHVTGDETDGTPRNLIYLCRKCNGRKGVQQARNRIGVRTRQYNPAQGARTLTGFRNAAAVLIGEQAGDVCEATAVIYNTSPDKRARFASELAGRNPFKSEAQRRKFLAMASRGEISQATLKKFQRETPPGALNPAPTFAQYAHGVAIHRRGAKDEGGAIIHATPASLRSSYARKIAAIKKERGTAGGGAVPF